MEKKINDIEAM